MSVHIHKNLKTDEAILFRVVYPSTRLQDSHIELCISYFAVSSIIYKSVDFACNIPFIVVFESVFGERSIHECWLVR